MNQKNVKQEFTEPAHGMQIYFSSSEVVVPNAILTIALARFSFFYWVWYLNECSQKQLQGDFTATPPFTSGFFTFKPKAARDGLKVENAIKEIFKRASGDILLWAEQLKQYVNDRLDPLRDIEKIIE